MQRISDDGAEPREKIGACGRALKAHIKDALATEDQTEADAEKSAAGLQNRCGEFGDERGG